MYSFMQSPRAAGRGLLVLFVFAMGALGQGIPEVLSLDHAIRLAIEQNPTLQAARNDVEILAGDRIDASRRLNPAFTFESANYPYFRSNPGPFFDNQEITARFDYEIETRGRRRLRTRAAEQAVDAQESLWADRTRQLRLEVQRAFYQVVLAQSNLDLAQDVLQQTDEVIELNRVRFEQGDISELELRRVQVERLQFADAVLQSELALRNAKSTLLMLVNADDLSQEFSVDGRLALTDRSADPWLPTSAALDELLNQALANRPDLRAARLERERTDTETRLQLAIRVPNLTVGGGYRRNGPDNSMVFGVTVPLRVFNQNQGGVARAIAEQSRARHLGDAMRKLVELETQKAYNAADVNRRRVEYIETQPLEKARQANEVTLAAYRLGGATLIDYLDAARRYSDTIHIYNQALYDERISLYELANAIGIEGDQ